MRGESYVLLQIDTNQYQSLKSGTTVDQTGGDSAEEDNEEDDDEFSPEKLLAQLQLEEEEKKRIEEEERAAKALAKAASQESSSAAPKAKRNRRKEKIAAREAANAKISEEAAAEAATQPDLRKIELDNMTSICELRGLSQYEIPADGHCLFASIADQLKIRHGVTKTVQELRTAAANHIRAHPDDFSAFLFDEATMSVRDVESYCVELESTPIWGGDLEILAFSQIFDCCISVLINGQSPFVANESGHNAELKLAYYKHSFGLGAHYNSLHDK